MPSGSMPSGSMAMPAPSPGSGSVPPPSTPGFGHAPVDTYGDFRGVNPYAGSMSAEQAKTASALGGVSDADPYSASVAAGMQGVPAPRDLNATNPYGQSPYGAYVPAPNAAAGAWNMQAATGGIPSAPLPNPSGPPGYDPYRQPPSNSSGGGGTGSTAGGGHDTVHV